MRHIIVSIFLATPLAAQDTAGGWAPTFTARHAGWDVTCDRLDDQERCYIRYIDAYAPRPNFGVVFFFLEVIEGAPVVTLGREFETDLETTTFRVAPGWDGRGHCTSGPCALDGADATALSRALADGGVFEIGFVDGQGQAQLRRWSSDGFAAALGDVTREAAKRGL